jgi:DNA-binding NarL/FixJ family response regulator
MKAHYLDRVVMEPKSKPPRKGTRQGPHAFNTKLSPQEERLLEYVRQGFRDSEIATVMQLSEGTVGVYLQRARAKLGEKARARRAFVEARERERACGFDPCDHCAFRGLARYLKLLVAHVLEAEE